MSEAPASSESLPQYRSRLRLPWLLHRRASELIGDGSVQHKTVRFGNLEPTHITLVKRSILPSLVVLTLALCMHLDRQHWSLESLRSGARRLSYRGPDLRPAEPQPRRDGSRLQEGLADAPRMELRGGDPDVPVALVQAHAGLPSKRDSELVSPDARGAAPRRLVERTARQMVRLRARPDPALHHHRRERPRFRARAPHRSNVVAAGLSTGSSITEAPSA